MSKFGLIKIRHLSNSFALYFFEHFLIHPLDFVISLLVVLVDDLCQPSLDELALDVLYMILLNSALIENRI